MRDLLFTAFMAFGLLQALRQPWIGALLWVFVGLMNPHRYTFGFAYELPWSAMIAAATLLGLLFTRDRVSPWPSAAPVLVVAFMVWITISWLNGFYVADDYAPWSRAMKTFFMLLVAMSLLHTRQRILALAMVCAFSLGILGLKGGLFTIATGGSYRVWGPLDSWVAENNAFGVALIMTIPLLRFLQTQAPKRWQRHALTVSMVLCAASALGSQSRGALLAISCMTLLLWWRGRSRVFGGLALLAMSVALISFMPDSWTDRMGTINTYTEDASAASRLASWTVARGLAADYVTGAGFSTQVTEYFVKYAGMDTRGWVAHSIYFEVLGQHGYIGLAIFLAIWIATWYSAGRIRSKARGIPEAQWCISLADMCQVSLLGYAVGGAFLTLAFYDLPYYVMALVVLTRSWLERRGWEAEAQQRGGNPLGIAVSRPAPKAAARGR